MLSLETAVTKLNYTIDPAELQEFYHTIKTKYSDDVWTWAKNQIHINDVAAGELVDTAHTVMYGWPLQSNLIDKTIPPSILKTRYPTGNWYNTELMSGLALRIQEHIPYSYRWTLFVLPPGGRVPKHNDIGEYVVHIPIQWDKDAVFLLDNVPYSLTDIGSSYVVDVEIPHETVNMSTENRVGLIFRIPRDKLSDLLEVTGQL
jgi:hypothetical protein